MFGGTKKMVNWTLYERKKVMGTNAKITKPHTRWLHVRNFGSKSKAVVYMQKKKLAQDRKNKRGCNLEFKIELNERFK